MRKLVFLILAAVAMISSAAQNITATKPAKLQVYFSGSDSQQLMMSSETLAVYYDNLRMTGELLLESLVTEEQLIQNLLDSALSDRITFSGVIPEGQFVYESTADNRFSVETDVFYGNRECRILLEFLVSNRKTSLANTFEITCTGTISLANDLGVTPITGLDDKVSFQFFQNVITRTY